MGLEVGEFGEVGLRTCGSREGVGDEVDLIHDGYFKYCGVVFGTPHSMKTFRRVVSEGACEEFDNGFVQ